MAIDRTDLTHLGRCVELATEALEAGDEPFGSLLVDASGQVLVEERNRVSGGDRTRHPELAIARWAPAHLAAAARATATVYTSGEHCPMCAAAHAMVGLGRIVHAVSAARLSAWQREWGAADPPVRPLAIRDVAPGLRVDGPAPELEATMRELHRRAQRRAR